MLSTTVTMAYAHLSCYNVVTAGMAMMLLGMLALRVLHRPPFYSSETLIYNDIFIPPFFQEAA